MSSTTGGRSSRSPSTPKRRAAILTLTNNATAVRVHLRNPALEVREWGFRRHDRYYTCDPVKRMQPNKDLLRLSAANRSVCETPNMPDFTDQRDLIEYCKRERIILPTVENQFARISQIDTRS